MKVRRLAAGPGAALLLGTGLASTGCVGATTATIVVARDASSVRSVVKSATTVALPSCVGELSTEQKAGQLLMVLVATPSAAADLVGSGSVGGYALVGSQNPAVGNEIAAVAARSKLPVLAAGDEEGGTVQRFRDVLGPLPSAASLAKTKTPRGAGIVFGQYATRLRALGLNMNFGPSLDVGGGSGLGTRSFSGSTTDVTKYGLSVIEAVRSAGLVPVAKHWPGIGSGTADPHSSESPIAGLATLRKRDMIPFDRAIADGLTAVMVSHAIIPGVTQGLPASLSKAAITGELRNRHHFDGLVVTDSLGMAAVSTQFDEAAAAALSIIAGADVALIERASDVAGAKAALLAAVGDGRISAARLDRSVARVLTAKGVTGPCPT